MAILRLLVLILFISLSHVVVAKDPNDGGIGGTGNNDHASSFDLFEVPDSVADIDLEVPEVGDFPDVPDIEDVVEGDVIPDFGSMEDLPAAAD